MAVDDPLVDVSQIEVRLGRSLTEDETGRAQALIEDVSGEIYTLIGSGAFHDDDGNLAPPAGVIGVVCRAVIRQFENPRGLTGETIGDYNWQANNGRADTSVFFTPAELRGLRRAAGLPGFGSIQMEGDLPLDCVGYFDITTLS